MSETDRLRDEPGAAEALFAAWATRAEAGESLDFEALVRAHSSIEGELRQLHGEWQFFAPLLGRIVPGLIASESGVVVPSLSGGPDAEDGEASSELLARLGLRAPNAERYRFRAVLGRGGGGVVLKVWDSKLNRPLAMKVVLGRDEERPTSDTPRVDGRTLTRFVDEARIASQLNHPGIVPVHELGADETGRAYFTMKLVKGDDLSVVFERVRSAAQDWSEVRALGLILRVCEAMAYAHDKGVIHRDLKPANVMVGAYGEVHVMDWGLARVVGEKDHRDLRIRPASVVHSMRKTERDETPGSPLVTMDGSVVGTPCYMPPEQAKGQLELVGPHSDVYSVGAMLYHLIAGEMPYVPRDARVPPEVVLANVMHGPPRALLELAPRAPGELIAICEKAMAREIADRYSSMRALADDLRAFLDGRVVGAYETGTWAETRKWVMRNRTLAASLGSTLAIALVSVIAVAVYADRERSARRDAVASAREAGIEKVKAERTAYLTAITSSESALTSGDARQARYLLDNVTPDQKSNWEWRYLDAQADTSLLRIMAQIGYSGSLEFTGDGTKIVAYLDSGAIGVWTADEGAALMQIPGRPACRGMTCLSRSGRYLAAITEDPDRDVLWLWDANSCRAIWNQRVGDPTTVEFTADERMILASYSGHEDDVRAWDVQTGASATPPNELPSRDVWPSENRQYARACEAVPKTDTARIIDSKLYEEVIRLVGHVGEVTECAISHDATLAATAADDGTVRIWDATDQRTRSERLDHEGEVWSAVFSPDGIRLVTGSTDGMVRVWDAATSELIFTLRGHSNSVASIAFSADGTLMATASGDASAIVWDAVTGELLFRPETRQDHVSSVCFSPDGKRLATSSVDHHDASIWDICGSGAPMRLVGHSDQVNSVEFSPGGVRVVTASSDHTARLWDAASGACVTVLQGHTDWVVAAEFSSDSKRVVTASRDGTARLWNAGDGALIYVLDGHSEPVVSACVSTDGAHVVTASVDGTARVWDAHTGSQVSELRGHRREVTVARFFGADTRVVTASEDGSARIWDWLSGLALVKLDRHSASVRAVAISPDETLIVTGSEDESARVWDSIPYRLRYRERHAIEAAKVQAERALQAALETDHAWRAASRRLREDASLDPFVERSAVNLLSQRANRSLLAVETLVSRLAERTWIARMIGREVWPDESTARDDLLARSLSLDDPEQCLDAATRITLSDPPSYGEEVQAVVLARHALDGTRFSVDKGGANTSTCRDVLARALFRVGRFDDALVEQRNAVVEAGEMDPAKFKESGKCRICNVVHGQTLVAQLRQLEDDIAQWRDEHGGIRVAEWTTRIEELDREIAAIEADPDVQIWMRHRR